MKEAVSRAEEIQARLEPNNIDEFIRYYFGKEMGQCHKIWFKHYILNPDIQKLLLEAPMGHGKSQYLAIWYAIWLICRNPRIRIILAGATLERAMDNMRQITRELENNEKLIRDFGPFKGKDPEKWTEKVIYVEKADRSGHPTLRVTAVDAATAGMRGDVIIGDDLVNIQNSNTDLGRARLKYWVLMLFLTRMEPHGIARFIGTEYGEMTLYQDIILHRNNEFEGWVSVVYKAIDPENPGPDGELWPEHWPMERLLARKKEIGVIAFEMTYQNNPRAMIGKIFKNEYLRRYTNPPMNLNIFQAVDLSISGAGDFFVIITIGVEPETENVYILDVHRDRPSFPDQVQAIRTKFAVHKPLAIAIESNAYQRAMPQQLRSMALLPIKEVHTGTSKALRMMALTVYFEQGKIYIPDEQSPLYKPWVAQFVDEYISYDPVMGHSPDQLDALDMALELGLKGRRKYLSDVGSQERDRKGARGIWGF
jgi:predicted phage terminase large subunit-like protein